MTTIHRPPPNDERWTPGQLALLQHKIHVERGALAHSRGDIQERLSSPWSAALRLIAQWTGLPDELFLWWAAQPRGHVLITAADEGYCIDARATGDRALAATALVPMRRVVHQPRQAALLALLPLDHLLGCNGDPTGPWLSEGGGRCPRWQRVGEEIAALFALGYGTSEAARHDPHSYLAEALWMAIHERQRLNIADPKLDRLLHASLLSAPFWRNFRRQEGA